MTACFHTPNVLQLIIRQTDKGFKCNESHRSILGRELFDPTSHNEKARQNLDFLPRWIRRHVRLKKYFFA